MAKKTSLLGNLNLGNIDETNKEKEEVISEENKEIVLAHYDFNYDIDDNLVGFLKEQTLKLQGTMSKAYTELGKILLETQEKLSNNKNGVFEKWFVQLGFSKRTVYNLVNRANYIVQNLHNKNLVEALPLTLSYEISNPSCSEELREKVLAGEIKTLAEFMIEKQSKITNIEEAAIIDEPKDYFSILENDFKKFNKSYKNLNNIFKEKAKDLSEEKQKSLAEEIEIINKKIEKMLKSL